MAGLGWLWATLGLVLAVRIITLVIPLILCLIGPFLLSRVKVPEDADEQEILRRYNKRQRKVSAFLVIAALTTLTFITLNLVLLILQIIFQRQIENLGDSDLDFEEDDGLLIRARAASSPYPTMSEALQIFMVLFITLMVFLWRSMDGWFWSLRERRTQQQQGQEQRQRRPLVNPERWLLLDADKFGRRKVVWRAIRMEQFTFLAVLLTYLSNSYDQGIVARAMIGFPMGLAMADWLQILPHLTRKKRNLSEGGEGGEEGQGDHDFDGAEGSRSSEEVSRRGGSSWRGGRNNADSRRVDFNSNVSNVATAGRGD